jgi:hypothetical protein
VRIGLDATRLGHVPYIGRRTSGLEEQRNHYRTSASVPTICGYVYPGIGLCVE